MTPELLTSVVKQAIQKTKNACRCEGDPLVMPLSPVFYSEFNSLVNKTDPGAKQALEGAADGILVAPTSETVEEFPHVFRMTLKEPGKYLFRLAVDYEDGSSDSFSPSDKEMGEVTQSGTDSQNRAQYWVRLKKYPKQYTITAKELGGADQTYSGDWPRTRQHFAVTFRDFQGDFEALRGRLLDKGPEGTSEPIDQIAEFADNRFVLAAIGFPIFDANDPGLRPDNRITITVTPPLNVDVVWVKLPYGGDTLKDELKEWNTLKDGEGVITKLKGENPDTRASTEVVEISSTTAPKWYRLTLTNRETHEFSREFTLTDQPEFVKKFSPLSVAVIHQADDDVPGQIPVASTIGEDWVRLATWTEKQDADLGTGAKPSGAAPGGAAPATPSEPPMRTGTPPAPSVGKPADETPPK